MKKILYFVYVFLISFLILEIGIRVITKENPKDETETLLGKSHRYLLPFPKREAKTNTSKKEKPYHMYSANLGWSHKPWGKEEGVYFSNYKGWRITRDEYKKQAKDTVDIVYIGDSFTHGDSVLAEQTWPHLYAQQVNKSFTNLAVGGYRIDQALMRLMFNPIHADTVLFGVISGDFERALDPVYGVYLGISKTKPCFTFSKDTFGFVNIPVLLPNEYEQLKETPNAELFQHIHGYVPYFYADM